MVVIEGPDKAGKSTQARMLNDSLMSMGYRTAVMSFPDYSTPIGREIDAFLHGRREYPLQVKHMLLSANRWEKKEEIERLLASSDILILNRYYQSNIVYGVANGLDQQWLEMLDRCLPREDLVIVLHVSADVALERARMNSHKDEFENMHMLRLVSSLYMEMASMYGWVVIDGNRSREEVHRDILDMVLKHYRGYRA
ncbi:MAG: dTMP kinase [Candidatus Nitrosocaldus sp.]|nr:dTMP kinase [Candidatus Nitrosocaldus sp.]MDW8274826.1 dTMP kinase [Candidatus Nitrosocaldus sp.]